MKILKTFSILAITGVFLTSCVDAKKEETTTDASEILEAEETTDMGTMDEQSTPNIVEVAIGDERFSTLVAAVKAADLVETLSSAGPFTVFAPTNDAFAKLPGGTLDTLLKDENKAKLSGILTYHVISGNYDAASVIDAIKENNGKFTVTTVNGGTIALSLKDGNVVLTDANGAASTVVIADVAASNGVIHAIDTVVMPK